MYRQHSSAADRSGLGNACPPWGSNHSGEVAQGSSVSPEMCFPDVIGTAVNNSYSEQTG